MNRPPTRQELLKFHGYLPGKKVKKPPVKECRLMDINGRVLFTGSYALCADKKKVLGGTIKVIREGDTEQVFVKNSPFEGGYDPNNNT